MRERWTIEKAREWYSKYPWPVGCNFIPSTAINQLEMWQEDTFDAETIDRELGWAAGLGMNTVRVFLHDAAWSVDPGGFRKRVRRYLEIAGGRGLLTVFVLFDDCWHPDPKPGRQPDPRPGIHNSGWVQSPGVTAARDRSEWKRLESYVRDIVGMLGRDDRVLMWDLYNEVGNFFLPALSLPAFKRIPKLAYLLFRHRCLPIETLPLFRAALRWVRDSGPSQPVTAGIWFVNGGLNRELIGASDIITFHNYRNAANLEARIRALKKHGRPVLCTEYLARSAGSRFETCMPVFKRHGVGCCSWGLVSGKTQTIFSWTDRGGNSEPGTWYHDIFRRDGTPYSEEEISFIRAMTGAKASE